MSLSIRLHTAARRFALDAHHRWATHYVHSGASDRPSSAEARGIFPRYLVYEAMLWALEVFAPEEVPRDLPAAREDLAAAVLRARSIMTDNLDGQAEINAMDEERHLLAAYIRSVSTDQLLQVEPLPYRRVLSAAERQRQEQVLERVWGAGDGYWYPLNDIPRTDVVAFEAPEFHRDIGAERLRAILRAANVGQVYELTEFVEHPAYEQDLEACGFRYTGAEGYWCDTGMEWIVYASHEDSITLGGQWLIDRVQESWSAWPEHIWNVSSITFEPPAT